MIQVNERSTAVLSMTFTDETKAPVIPTSARYCVLDELSGTVLSGWTSFTPTVASYDLTISQDNNRIIDDSRDTEVRIVTVVFEYYYGSKQCTGEFRYEVKNLTSVPPGIVLTCTGGAILGGSCVFTTT